jgi:hypothetical protein
MDCETKEMQIRTSCYSFPALVAIAFLVYGMSETEQMTELIGKTILAVKIHSMADYSMHHWVRTNRLLLRDSRIRIQLWRMSI